jgi:hypothetical protein
MEKFKVEFIQKETFVIDIYGKDENDAVIDASRKFKELEAKGLLHYNSQTGGPEITTGNVYNVTNTDDPFNP